jgi:hypothetical protein
VKPSILAAILTATLFLVPIAHAQTGPAPIGNPETDTLQVWNSIASSIETITQEAMSAPGRLTSAIQELASAVAVLHSPQTSSRSSPPQVSAPAAQAASLATAVAAFETSDETPTSSPPSQPDAQIGNVPSAQPIIERITEYEPLASDSFVTQDELTSRLQQFSDTLAAQFDSVPTSSFPENVAADGNPEVPYAAENAINNLSNVTITNANLTASEIPGLDYLSLSGGTLSGDLVLNGNATTTGTSYFTGDVGIGTSTSDALAIEGSEYLADITPPTVTANRLYSSGGDLYWAGSVVSSSAIGHWTSDGTNAWRLSGDVGIGTSSPFAALSVVGNGYFTGALTAASINAANATTTNATSTTLFSTFGNFTTGLIDTLSGTTLSYNAASTTNFSNSGTAYFGSTATTTIDSAGDLNVGGSFTANGNVALGNATSTSLAVSGTASTSNLVASNSFTLGTVTGILHSVAGVVSASLVNLASDVTGVLPVANGGTGWASLAAGYIPFGNGSSALATSSNLFFDSIDGRLGIGTTSPFTTLSVNGNAFFNGNLTATNYYGNISSSTVLATGATTARDFGDIANDVVNVKSFGATGNGITNDTSAINAAISYIRNADDAAGTGATNKYELYFPQGNYVIGSPINLTCYSDPNSTSATSDGCENSGSSQLAEYHGVLPVVGYGAEITCDTSGAPCIDGLGSRAIQISGLSIVGSCTLATEPDFGVQIGRTVYGSGADGWYLHQIYVAGCYTKAAFYNLASEDLLIDGNSFVRNADTNETFATSTGPYDAIWDSGNHWQVTSQFVNEQIPRDDPNSFNDNQVVESQFYPTSSSHSSGLWIYGTRRLSLTNTYIVTNQGACVTLYFDATSGGSTTNTTNHTPEDDQFNFHCEGSVAEDFLITGYSSNPIIKGLSYNDEAVAPTMTSANVFALDTGVSGLTLQNANINIVGGSTSDYLWDNPANYTVSGNIYLPANGTTVWQQPENWTGCVYVGNSSPSCGGTTETGSFNINTIAGGTLELDGRTMLTASSTLETVFLGYQAGDYSGASTGQYDTAFGWQALSDGAAASRNTAFGFEALQDFTGVDNVAVGADAGEELTSGNNVALGSNVMRYHTTGAGNTAVGAYAMYSFGGSNGSDNTVLGNYAGDVISSGADNTFLGFDAASTTATGSNNILIGYQLDLPSVNGSNQLDIGNLIFGTGLSSTYGATPIGDVGIGTTTPSARLSVWGADSASSTSAFNIVNSASTTVFSVFDGGNAELSGSLSQSSDERLKTNVQSLDASSSLSSIDELNPVTFHWIDPDQTTTLQLGFIAQQVQQIFPNLVSTTSATALTPDGTLSLNYIGLISPIVSAIQALDQEISTLAATVAGFAQSLTTQVLNASQGNFSNELCVGSTCVTPAQFQAMVAAASASQSPGQDSGAATFDDSQATDTPPIIQINGANPAIVQAGDSYSDLGATITGPTADLNLGITTYVNGIETSPVQIDTSAAATDTVDYVVTDQNGITSTSTRTVIIEGSPSIIPTDATTTAQ